MLASKGKLTLCASSTTNTFPVPTSARAKNLVKISNKPHADPGSMNGSDRSTIVSSPAAKREGYRDGRVSMKELSKERRCSRPAVCAGLKVFSSSLRKNL